MRYNFDSIDDIITHIRTELPANGFANIAHLFSPFCKFNINDSYYDSSYSFVYATMQMPYLYMHHMNYTYSYQCFDNYVVVSCILGNNIYETFILTAGYGSYSITNYMIMAI